MDNSLTSLIDSANSVLILLPNKPYFDQVAAGLALYLSLHEYSIKESKKEVVISSASPMVVSFNRLIGVNKITTEVGNKNLVIKFKDYDANNIEKVSYDILGSEFNLTVTPKPGFTSPKEEQIEKNYSGISADLVVLVGGANESHFAALSTGELEGAKVTHIGTRVLTTNGGSPIMSFAKPASSVSELVTSLIRDTNLPVDADVATNLVMGIEEGTNHFEGEGVTPETFEAFAYLLRNGGQRPPKQKLNPESFPIGSIPGMQVFNQGKQINPQVPMPEVKEDQNAAGDLAQEGVVQNPPQDWLSPKVIRGASSAPSQPSSFGESKG